MSLEIWMTQAGIGDCILVRCGRADRKVNILIDSGQGATVFDSVLRRISRNDEKIDMLILTHDDNDHVKGACNLVERIYRDDKEISMLDVPIHAPFAELREDHILFNFGGNREKLTLAARDVQKMAESLRGKIDFHRLGFVLSDEIAADGCQYPNMLQLQWEIKNGVVQSQIIRQPDKAELCTDKEHLELVILSPKKETLLRYIDSAWGHIDKVELLKESSVLRENEWDRSIQHFMDYPICIGNDKKLANNASIAFLLLYEGHSILFCGDGSPDEMTDAGREYLRRSGSEVDHMELDCIKLPHHGSSHNVSREFLRFFRTGRYLISTRGHAGYRHPGKGTLAEIAAALAPDARAQIYGNYEWWHKNRNFWCAEELEHNWEGNHCKLTGADGMSRYLDFHMLAMEPIMIEEGFQISL